MCELELLLPRHERIPGIVEFAFNLVYTNEKERGGGGRSGK